MEDNLNFKKMELDLASMKLNFLDGIDGLDVPDNMKSGNLSY